MIIRHLLVHGSLFFSLYLTSTLALKADETNILVLEERHVIDVLTSVLIESKQSSAIDFEVMRIVDISFDKDS